MDENWPVNNWWDTVTCQITNKEMFYARIRAGKWSQCLGSFHIEKVLRSLGVLGMINDGVVMECINNPLKFVEFLMTEAKKNMFLYKIDKKYLKILMKQ